MTGVRSVMHPGREYRLGDLVALTKSQPPIVLRKVTNLYHRGQISIRLAKTRDGHLALYSLPKEGS